jgi:hypothetical protein
VIDFLMCSGPIKVRSQEILSSTSRITPVVAYSERFVGLWFVLAERLSKKLSSVSKIPGLEC